jgi:ABC-type branched-subunit amino acid transport system substrate-binding protein
MKYSTKPYHFTLLLLLLFPALLLLPNQGYTQSFEDGIEMYQQGKYEEALDIFSRLDSDEALLFTGKTYFGLGKYLTAKPYLESFSKEDTRDLFQEAQFTLALTDFQLGQYGDALNRLYRVKQQDKKTQIVTDGIQLYEDILEFLTINQRRSAFQQAEYPEIKYDLVASAFGDVSYPIAKTLYSQLVKSQIDTSGAAMQELSKTIADSMSYAIKKTYSNRKKAPRGITYNIGAALPTYTNDAPEFKVTQGLYFGYVLAAEQFNQQHADGKAFIRHQNTGVDMDSAEYAMTELAWNSNADAVLGPLLSEPARQMANLAEQYQIPMLAPLANSDTLNIDNPYVYQANPTFTSHGRKMAQYAVKNLQMDTLAVLAEEGSLGEASAFAFREQAEKLGAKVAHFFVDDFEAKGYDLSDYTKYFTADEAKIDSLGDYHHLDGIYAPFTSQAAPTLAELLLVDLEAMNSNIPVLGSQKWGDFQLPETAMETQEVYFSESYYINQKSERVEQFKKQFKARFDMAPNRFAMIGYDTASYLLRTLNNISNPQLLKNALKSQPAYEGLISNINFKGTHINQEVKIFKITVDSTRPVLK